MTFCCLGLKSTVFRLSSLSGVAGLLLLWLFPSGGVAQPDSFNQSWRWALFTIDDGLPSDHVFNVVETTDGTAWAATKAGLAWFDDFRWHSVTAEDGTLSDGIETIVPGLDGKIFVIANKKLYHGDTQALNPVPLLFEGGTRSVQSVVPLDGSSFLVLADRQLFQVSAGGQTPIPLPRGVDAAPVSRTKLVRTRSGNTWLSTKQGLYQWTKDRWNWWIKRRIRVFRENETCGLLSAGTSRVSPGLWKWRPGSQPVRLDSEKRILVTMMDIGPNGEALTIYVSGEVRYREKNRWHSIEPLPAQMMSPHFVRFRQNGDLWLGTEQGLFLHRRQYVRWTHWTEDLLGGGRSINALLHTRNDDIWIGTDAGLFVRRVDGSTIHLTPEVNPPLPNITGLAEDRQGGIWVSSGSSFVGAYRWHQDKWQHFGPKQGLRASRIHKIVTDRRGQLWFLGMATIFGGTEADPEPGAFVYDGTQFNPIRPTEGIPYGRVYDLVDSLDGTVWFGTLGGLSRLKDEQWTHWTVGKGLKASRIFALALTEDGRVWFGHQGHGHGLGYLDENERVHYLTGADGLVDSNVWSLRVGPDGSLWISTFGGLSRFRDGAFSSFGPSSGLEYSRLWPILPLEDRVYVGSMGSGVFVLSLEESRNPPPVVELSQPLADGQTTYLNWQAFAYEGEMPAGEIETRYRLNAGAWSRWGTTRGTTLLTLPSGGHTFSVQAKSLFGTTNPSGTTVAFRIAPPFYRHPLFLTAVFIWLASMAGWGLAYWRKQRRYHSLLRQQERHFRTLIENASDLITVLDRGGTVLYQSPSVERILGYRPEELVGKCMFEFVHPGDAGQLHRILSSVTTDREPMRPMPLRLRYGKSEWKLIEVVGRMVPLENGVPALVINARDITERKRAEEAIRRAQEALLEFQRGETELAAARLDEMKEQLVQQTRLATIGQLTSSVAHEIRNPLGAVRNAAYFLKRHIDDPRLVQYLEIIDQEIHSADCVIRNMLEMARSKAPIKESFDLTRIVREVFDRMDEQASVRYDLVSRPDPFMIVADRGQIHQVLVNLVTNAVQSVNGSGEIRVELSSTGEFDLIVVEDNGPGIDVEHRHRLFKPLFSTKGKGTGLGLTICREIVERHGGTIVLQDDEGAGTSFRVKLPRNNPQDAP